MDPLIHDFLDIFHQCFTEKNGFYVLERRVQEHCILYNSPVNVIVLDSIVLDHRVNLLEVKAEPPHFLVSLTPFASGNTTYFCNQTEKITIPYMDYDEIECTSITKHKLLDNKAEEMLAYQLWTFSAVFASLIVLNLY